MRALGWYLLSTAVVAWTFCAAVPAPPLHVIYVDQPPLAHTGGFGEPTCRACHFDQPLNASSGTLTLLGLPDAYTPGQRYELTVRLYNPDLGRGGFQLAARFTASGKQAGHLHASNDRSTVTRVDSTGIQYATHTPNGVQPTAPDTIEWIVAWQASSTSADVQFHASANAASDDASAFGDFIFTSRHRLSPVTEK